MTQSRGGRRGGPYAQRSDLNAGGKVNTSDQYGAKTQQAAATAAVPVATGPQTPSPYGDTVQAPAGPAPGELGDLFAPTTQPGTPVTDGAASGPGAGPTVANPDQLALAQWVPYLESAITAANCPPSVANALRWIKAQSA